MPVPLMIALSIGAGLVLGMASFYLVAQIRGRNVIGLARRQAGQIVSDAEREAASTLKETATSIKEERIELHAELERESREMRRDLVALEKRIAAKEESVEKRTEGLESKAAELTGEQRELERRAHSLADKQKTVEAVIADQTQRLQDISGMTGDEARRELFSQLEAEVRRESAIRLKRVEDELIETADKKAHWIISQAIQRTAADHVTEAVVSVVTLPNDEMKGRIIGREGRNIRALESATGINVIIDDTPEAVILSGFDTVRREIARLTVERLIQDGRIHPARIEEVVKKVSEEMARTIRETGEEASLEVDIHGLHPEIIKLLGRLSFRTSYGQNVLQHSKEVCHLAGIMAAELGMNGQEAKRAGFIHDIGKAVTHEVEGSHALIGRDLARRYGEKEVITNAIGSHHNEIEQTSVTAVLVQAADALSAARPGARRETVDAYVKRLEQLEEIASSFPGVEKSFALQAGREIRLAVCPEKINDAQARQLAREVARKVEGEMTYPGQIQITVVRETRAVDTAK